MYDLLRVIDESLFEVLTLVVTLTVKYTCTIYVGTYNFKYKLQPYRETVYTIYSSA